ncbi:MAG: hypothetical protein R2932_48445 [Caldilineaceae bacterium]
MPAAPSGSNEPPDGEASLKGVGDRREVTTRGTAEPDGLLWVLCNGCWML